MFRRCVVVLLFCAFQISKCEKSSLAFVIDETSSMQPVIDQVIAGVNAITDIVINKRSSQIVDYVLVTFNDPDTDLRIKTQDRDKLRSSLRQIDPKGGHDCPEMSLTGIEKALKNCRHGSYVYVFTDDAPNEKNADVVVERIKGLCQEKQIQIVIVITPYAYCMKYHESYKERFNYYEDIAASSSGQVYRLDKVEEVTEILKIIEETVNGKRVVDTALTFPANKLSHLKFTIDDQTDYAVVSTSGKDVTFDLITGPTLMYEKKVWTSNVKAVKISPPGEYVALVNSKSNSSVVVFKRTDFLFEYGFSENPASSLSNISKQSIFGKESHLLISIFDSSHKIRVNSVDILDLKGNILGHHNLNKVSNDFYTTEKFLQPINTFKIAVNGITPTNKNIQRISKTPVSPFINTMTPKINFNVTNGKEVPYDSNLSVACRVKAYPPPDVKWLHEKNKTIINEMVEQMKYPYLYRSILVIEHIKKPQKFTCIARNGMGHQTVNYFIKVKEPFTVINVPTEVTKAKYGKSLDLKCLVTSYLPVNITWMRTTADGKSLQINPSRKYEMSADKTSLKIKNFDLTDKGHYKCKVELSHHPEKNLEFKTLIDINTIVPVIDKHASHLRKLKTSHITLSCSALNGIPEPSFMWYFTNQNGRKTLIARSNVFNILNATLNDTGNYTCVAENVAGKDDYTIHILIEELPKLEKGISTKTVLENAPAEILCESVEGVPLPKITCQFKSIGSTNFQNVDCNQIKHITSVSTQNSGEYKCTAKNDVGVDNHIIVLNVNVPPQVDKNVINIIKTKGSDVQLNCGILRGNPKPLITWTFKNQKGIITKFNKNPLSLRNINLAHAGYYTCDAKNDAGYDNHTVHLIVQESPKLEKGISNITVAENTPVKILCKSVKGIPVPGITCQFKSIGSHNFQNIDCNQIQHIARVSTRHEGEYKCAAINELGADYHTITLYVNVPPQIDKNITNVSRLKETNIHFNCRILRGNPRPKVTWSFTNQKGVVTKINKNSLSITNLQLIHAGQYTCLAENGAGYDNHTVHLIVEEHPKLEKGISNITVLENTSAEILCKNVEGVPVPGITCQFKSMGSHDFQNIDCNQIQHIARVNTRHEGEYRCAAKNRLGTDYHTISLYVNVPPQIEKTVTNLIRHKETNINLNCRILRGNPKPQVTWSFTNQEGVVTKFSKNSLSITNLQLVNAGYYTCIAENVAGYDNYTVHLVVEESPKLVKLISNINVLENTSAEIMCKAEEGVPMPKIICQFKNIGANDFKNIDCSQIQHIARVSTENEGEYKCTAINSVGVDNHTVVLNVYVPPQIDKSISIVTEHENQKLQLNCSILRSNPRPQVTWSFTNNEGRVTYFNKDLLILTNLELTHAGNYTCVAENIVGEDNHTVHLLVEAKPKITNEVTTFEAVLHDTVLKVPCFAVGYPTPHIIWTEANHTPIVNNDVENGELVIKNLSYISDAVYYCRAINKLGFDEKMFNVFITSNNNYNVSDSNEFHILYGSDAQLNCSELDNNYNQRWYKNTVLDRVGAHYNIVNAASIDSANYTCRIDKNGTKNAKNDKTIVLRVGWPPEFEEKRNATIEFDGNVVTLPCDVRSKTEPFPTFTWTKNGVTIEGTRSVLAVDDLGDYKCHVRNVHGSIEKQFRVKSDILCLISKDRKRYSVANVPLILHDNTTLAVLKARGQFLLLESGTGIKFSCPNPNMFSSEKLSGKNFVNAECDHENKFIIDGQSYKFSELNCKDEVKSHIIKTEVKCMEESDIIKIGFKSFDFVEVFEACVKAENNHVFYTKLQLMNPYYDDSGDADPFAYLDNNELTQSYSSSCQLVNADDVTYGPAQKATSDVPFNNILCSKSNNGITWNDVEEIVRKIMKNNYDVSQLTVWTGTKQYNTSNEIAPQYLWKVVKNYEADESVAIVFNNQENVEDLCEKISQSDLPPWIDYPAYPIYPCTLNDFSEKVDIPVEVFS